MHRSTLRIPTSTAVLGVRPSPAKLFALALACAWGCNRPSSDKEYGKLGGGNGDAPVAVGQGESANRDPINANRDQNTGGTMGSGGTTGTGGTMTGGSTSTNDVAGPMNAGTTGSAASSGSGGTTSGGSGKSGKSDSVGKGNRGSTGGNGGSGTGAR